MMKKYSVDMLLKTKPEQIEGFEPIDDCGEKHFIVNGVNLLAETYEICYIGEEVTFRFFDECGELVCCVDAIGSCESVGKGDECFYIDSSWAKITSGTSIRILVDETGYVKNDNLYNH